MNRFIVLILVLIVLPLISFGQSRDKYIEIAAYCIDKQEYEKAIKIYNEAIQKYENDAHLYLLRGEAKTDYSIGVLIKNTQVPSNNNAMFKDALADFDTAIEIDKKYCPAYHARGYLNLNYQQYDNAISDYSKYLKCAKSDQKKFEGYVNRAACYLRKGDYTKALKDYNRAKDLDEDNFSTYTNIASIYSEQKNYVEAEKYLEIALKIDSTQISTRNNLGFLRIETGDYKGALEVFETLYKDNPNDPFTLNNLGYVQCKLGDYESGLTNINRSLVIYPDNSFAYKNRGVIYLDLNEENKACNDFNKAIEKGYLKTYGDDIQELIESNCN